MCARVCGDGVCGGHGRRGLTLAQRRGEHVKHTWTPKPPHGGWGREAPSPPCQVWPTWWTELPCCMSRTAHRHSETALSGGGKMAKAQGTRSRTQGRSQGMAAVSPAPGHATSEAWPRAHHSGGTGRSPARSAAPLASCRRRAWRDGPSTPALGAIFRRLRHLCLTRFSQIDRRK